MLNSYDVMKEAFVQKGQVFGGRPFDPKDKLINPNHPKILGQSVTAESQTETKNAIHEFHRGPRPCARKTNLFP